MYQPARSDLVAAALAAIISGLLLVMLRASIPVWAAVSLFSALPIVPATSALLSAPPHSFRGRFRFRGNAAVAGMGATILAFAALGDSYEAGRALVLIGGALSTFTFSALAYLIVLVAHILLAQERGAVDD